MNDQSLVINNRFFLDPLRNTLFDLHIQREFHLEPRLMQVLVFLVTNVNQVVSRKEITAQIWQDYGGGDEGLTQAVSHLRKFLSDDRKEVIITVPKHGYLLNARVTNEMTGDNTFSSYLQGLVELLQSKTWISPTVFLTLLVTGLIYVFTFSQSDLSADQIPETQSPDFWSQDLQKDSKDNGKSADSWIP